MCSGPPPPPPPPPLAPPPPVPDPPPEAAPPPRDLEGDDINPAIEPARDPKEEKENRRGSSSLLIDPNVNVGTDSGGVNVTT